jgi:hypothetical protein
VEPIPGESQQDFTDRVYQMCREACIDQVVDDYESGDRDDIKADDIGRCTHQCADDILDEIEGEDYWPENYEPE